MNETVRVDTVKNPCPQCGAEVPPKGHRGGRPKVYCSPNCRTNAGRHRRDGAPTRPVARSRRPLPDFAKDSGWCLRGDIERIERIERIFADDRFPIYRKQVSAQLRGHLEYAAEVCQDLLSRLDNPERE